MDQPEVINLSVVDIVENEDGSANVTFDFDEETKRFLIGYAITDILTKAAKNTKLETE